MVGPGPIADKAAQPQIRLDQRGRFQHGGLAVQQRLGQQVHRLPMCLAGDHAQGGRCKVVVVQPGQRLCQRGRIGAVETGDAEQHLDATLQHIVGQPVPQMEHRRPAPVIGMHAGPPQFQQSPTAGTQRAKVILALGIEPVVRADAGRGQHPVDPNDIVKRGRIPAAVDQDQVVEHGIVFIPLQPRRVIDQRAVAAQLLDEHRIAQPLGRRQIAGVARQTQFQMRVVGLHRPRPIRPRSCRAGCDPLKHDPARGKRARVRTPVARLCHLCAGTEMVSGALTCHFGPARLPRLSIDYFRSRNRQLNNRAAAP